MNTSINRDANAVYYIIKIGLKRCGCTKWLHQIEEIFLDFKKKTFKTN